MGKPDWKTDFRFEPDAADAAEIGAAQLDELLDWVVPIVDDRLHPERTAFADAAPVLIRAAALRWRLAGGAHNREVTVETLHHLNLVVLRGLTVVGLAKKGMDPNQKLRVAKAICDAVELRCEVAASRASRIKPKKGE